MSGKLDDIMKTMELDASQREVMDKIQEKQIILQDENERMHLEREQALRGAMRGDRESVKQLSRLEQGIQRNQLYQTEIIDIASGLTGELGELGQFLGDMSQYQGMEKLAAKLGFNRMADKRRLSRVKSSDVKSNLQTIIGYGHHMVKRLGDIIIENKVCYENIKKDEANSAEKLNKTEPLYEEHRAERERLERELNALEQEINTSDSATVAELEVKKSGLKGKLNEEKLQEEHFFAIVKSMREALPILRQHSDAYMSMIGSVNSMRVALKENIETVTNMYNSVPTAVQTLLSVKAASQYDKSMKKVTDISTDVVLKSAAGVLDEIASRHERPLLEPERQRTYKAFQAQYEAEFSQRMEEVKHAHSGPIAVGE